MRSPNRVKRNIRESRTSRILKGVVACVPFSFHRFKDGIRKDSGAPKAVKAFIDSRRGVPENEANET